LTTTQPAPFAFRPMTHADLPLLHRWFNEPHVSRWFGARPLADVVEEFSDYIDGRVPIHPFVVVHGGREIGMVEWERLGDFPEAMRLYGVDDPDASNCDVLIGELGRAHRGLGPEMIRAFLGQIIFADPRITTCIIDPHTENGSAIRAYEKAGFAFLRVAPEDGEGNAVYLMELRREDFAAAPPRAGATFVRPARDGELAVARDIDDDACAAYRDAGIAVALAHDHPFSLDEEARWRGALQSGRLLFACAPEGTPIGFSAVGDVDQRPFLHQISVRCAWMRRGVGSGLIERAKRWSLRQGELWLTTYDHVAWNRPWYERLGFAVVDESLCGPALRAISAKERAALPAPERRIVMRYRHAGPR
jgi:aminoglycoside 6'-N-acetyltransferase